MAVLCPSAPRGAKADVGVRKYTICGDAIGSELPESGLETNKRTAIGHTEVGIFLYKLLTLNPTFGLFSAFTREELKRSSSHLTAFIVKQ